MKLTAQVKLLATHEQLALLKQTMETANAACNAISHRAWQNKEFQQYRLHKLTYHEIRAAFRLTAQVVVRCIARVAAAYKLDRKTRRVFKSGGAIPYDDRILRWYVGRAEVSIWTVNGRQRIPFVCGERQRRLLAARQGETDLIYHRGEFYLAATCNVEEPEPTDVDDVLGVDFGVVNIAVDSDGEVHAGNQVNNVRHRHRRLRAKLQRKGTKAARRRLKKLAGKECRFAKHTNHVISKHIVAKAQGTRRAIAIEDLKGIRERVTARRQQRATLHSWAFSQLRQHTTYKAALAGVPLVLIDPRNTSRTCPACGYVDKRNRPNQSTFSCVKCGFAGPADHIAAMNIRVLGRGVVNRPYVSDAQNAA